MADMINPSLQVDIAPVYFEVQPDWIDYNGHMTESRYLFAASMISDALLQAVGVDLDYVAAGYSYYTVETHIMHLGEAKQGEQLTGQLQILSVDEKRLHIFITIAREDMPLASVEQMLLHVDIQAGKACATAPAIHARLARIRDLHAKLPRPAAAGRSIGAPKI